MSVPAEKIQAIRERTDIVALIGRCIELKKAGRDFVGLCPFHTEKSASFSVSAHKQMFYCFGCHVGGDAFNFTMRYDRLDFGQAARKLASAAGIEIEAEAPEILAKRRTLDNLAAINQAAQRFFTAQLWGNSGVATRRYLTGRKLPAAFAKAHGLGFGGEAKTFVSHMRQVLQKLQLPESNLLDAGLVGESESWPLFSGRLTFPIRDPEGRLVGFGGRRLNHDRQTSKYINSREGALFNKRQLLYGLDVAQDAIRRSRRIVLVEGYMDVLAAQRAEVLEAVAALGTALSAEHAQLCRRLADVAFVLLDADAAGQRAAYKAAKLLLQAGMQVCVVALAPGDDPDKVMREQGPKALQNAIGAAQPAIEYFMQAAFSQSELSVEARAHAARHLMPLVTALPTGLERDLYTSRLADRVGVSAQQLKRHVQQTPATQRKPSIAHESGRPQPTTPAKPASTAPNRPEAQSSANSARELELLRELLLFPDLRERLGELAEYMLVPENVALLEALANAATPIKTVLASHLSSDSWRRRLLQVEPVTQGSQEEVIVQGNRTFDDILARLKRRHIDAFLSEVLKQIAEAEASGQATDGLMRRKQELTARKRVLKRATRIERVRA